MMIVKMYTVWVFEIVFHKIILGLMKRKLKYIPGNIQDTIKIYIFRIIIS